MMKIFVHTPGKILFIECESSSTLGDIKTSVEKQGITNGKELYISIQIHASQYCGKPVDYKKQLKDYNILHTGYVLKWV